MYRAIAKGFKSRFVGERQREVNEEGSSAPSLVEFSDMLEQVDFQIRFLSGLLYRLAEDADYKKSAGIRILRNLKEIADYIYQNEADCVLLISPEHMPVVVKHKDLGWVRDADEFADWLMVHWRPETLVIAVS